jgi:hypothetical protein
MNINFNNSNMTNVQSYNDSTSTYLNPLSLIIALLYDNVSNSFYNNKFRISSITDNGSPAFARNGVSEAVSPITVTVPDNMYRIGTELATAITTELNIASNPIGWINPFISNTPHTGTAVFAGNFVQSQTVALASNSILITTVTGVLASTTAGGGEIACAVYRADTNVLIAQTETVEIGPVISQVEFTFDAQTVLPANATGIYFRFIRINGVNADFSYGTAGGNLSMSASIQTTINTFDVDFDANTSSLNFAYNTNAPASVANINPILVLNTIFILNGLNYDSSRLLGTTGSIIGGFFVSGSFQLPYANRVAGLLLPSSVDLQTLQTIRVHSNVAKRFFTKTGSINIPAQNRPLTLTDILFEIPTNALLGQLISFEPNDNRFYQEISSNFDELRITITDNQNNFVNFKSNAEINFLFSIEREIIIPSNEERIKALAEYNRFKSY